MGTQLCRRKCDYGMVSVTLSMRQQYVGNIAEAYLLPPADASGRPGALELAPRLVASPERSRTAPSRSPVIRAPKCCATHHRHRVPGFSNVRIQAHGQRREEPSYFLTTCNPRIEKRVVILHARSRAACVCSCPARLARTRARRRRRRCIREPSARCTRRSP